MLQKRLGITVMVWTVIVCPFIGVVFGFEIVMLLASITRPIHATNTPPIRMRRSGVVVQSTPVVVSVNGLPPPAPLPQTLVIVATSAVLVTVPWMTRGAVS